MDVDILSTLNKNGSGLNLSQLTASIVAAEIQPKQRAIERRMDATDLSISSLGQLRAGLDKVATAVSAINVTPILSAVSSGTGAGITISDKSKLVEGKTSLNVQSLARRQVLEFPGFGATNAVVGAGTISVEIGVWVDPLTNDFAANPAYTPQTLTIAPGATLEEVAAQLDGLEGMSARVLDKGDGTFSLGVVSELGAANGLRFTVTEDALNTGLAALDTVTTTSTKQIQAATDAVIDVDGLTVFRASNTVTDLIPGVKLDLTATGVANITIERDRETAADNLDFLVSSINESLTLLKTLTSRGTNGADRGALAGDRTVESIGERIRALVAAPISGHGESATYLADMGIATNRDGSLRFDRNRFDSSFDANPALFDAAFTDSLSSETDGITIVGTPLGTSVSGTFPFSRPGGVGSATIGGAPAIGTGLGNGTTRFVPLGGPLMGTVVTATDGIETADIKFGRSFMSLLKSEIDSALSSSGQIATREAQLQDKLQLEEDSLTALDAKAEKLTGFYSEKFTAMEVAIASLKSTGTYLTNLIASWNKST